MIWIVLVVVFVSIFCIIFGLFHPIYRVYRQLSQKPSIQEYARALDMLQHAIDYLEPLGFGNDLEFAGARWILQFALDEVKRELFQNHHVSAVVKVQSEKTEVVHG